MIQYFFKEYIFGLILIGLLFLGIGYALSDDLYFNNLIKEHRITTPEEAFSFVQEYTYPVDDPSNPNPPLTPPTYYTPRYLFDEYQYLLCDQGSIVLATFVHELGYETRIVDLLDPEGMSRHTVLEVKQDGRWKLYDVLYDFEDVSYEESMPDGLLFSKTRYEPYPKLYNFIINNNYFLKQTALWLRGIEG